MTMISFAYIWNFECQNFPNWYNWNCPRLQALTVYKDGPKNGIAAETLPWKRWGTPTDGEVKKKNDRNMLQWWYCVFLWGLSVQNRYELYEITSTAYLFNICFPVAFSYQTINATYILIIFQNFHSSPPGVLLWL